MSDPNEDFAEAAVAAIAAQNQKSAEGASPAEGGTEPAESDPIQEYAKVLKEMGIAPDAARKAVDRIAYMQTPQGQEEMYRNYMQSEAGARLRQEFGNATLADLLAKDPGAVFRMAEELGYKPASSSRADLDEELTPELKEIRAMKAQQAALENRIKQLSEGAGSKIQELEGKLKGREDAESRRDVFVDWTKTQPPMAQKAYAAISKRAHELAALYPQYQGAQGFRRAVADAHNEISSAAPHFQPKPRPRNGSGGGGGVAGKSVDDSKLTLEQRIDAAAEDFARAARGED